MPESPATDRERLADALHVLHGTAGTGLIRRLLYAFYLLVLFGGVYGFNLLRAALVTADPQWVDAVASGWGVLAAVLVIVVLLVLAWRAGRIRGPVAPQLPFIDTVLTSAIDRGIVLRERGLAVLVGGFGTGCVLGALAGGAVLGAGRGGPAALVATVLTAALAGGLISWTALLGQRAASGPGAGRGRPRPGLGAVLRDLRIESLRSQAVRTTHVGGAVLAGDLRAARLDIAAPVTRARGVHLRSRGPWRTVIARDLLGLRRAPGRAAWAITGVATAYGLIAVSATNAAAPRAVAILAMMLAYFGFGAAAEGVRLLADTAGTPPLLGLPFRTEAALHLVLPVGIACSAGLLAAAGVALATGAPVVPALGAGVAVTAILAGATLMAAFRGSPPDLSFVGEIGPVSMAYWYARPVTVAAVSGGLLLAAAADTGPVVLAGAALTGAATIWYGIRLARTLELDHRG